MKRTTHKNNFKSFCCCGFRGESYLKLNRHKEKCQQNLRLKKNPTANRVVSIPNIPTWANVALLAGKKDPRYRSALLAEKVVRLSLRNALNSVSRLQNIVHLLRQLRILVACYGTHPTKGQAFTVLMSYVVFGSVIFSILLKK